MPQAKLESLIPDSLFRVSAKGVVVYVLVRNGQAALIGSGLPAHLPLIQSALAGQGLDWPDVRAILLTHAEVSHTGNAGWIQRRSNALVHINRLEMARLSLSLPGRSGRRPRGLVDRWQARGQRYEAPEVALFIGEGDFLDYWFGLRVIHLPGPTSGHCGFYCRHLNLIFTGVLPLKKRPALRQRVMLQDPIAARESLARVQGFGAELLSSMPRVSLPELAEEA